MFNTPEIIEDRDVEYLKKELLENGRIKLYPAAFFDSFDPVDLKVFCYKNARYGLITKELVECLKDLIKDRRAIEIGSGYGDLGYHLGIPMTDNKQQNWPELRSYYAALGQPIIDYPRDVVQMDALDAVLFYKPKVVVASWVTQWIDPDKPPTTPGNAWGIKEDEILKHVECYAMLGNKKVHDSKFICSLPHRELSLPFLRSRSSDNGLDRVYIWGG